MNRTKRIIITFLTSTLFIIFLGITSYILSNSPKRKIELALNDTYLISLKLNHVDFQEELVPFYDYKTETFCFFVPGSTKAKSLWIESDSNAVIGFTDMPGIDNIHITPEEPVPVTVNGSTYNLAIYYTSAITSLFVDTKFRDLGYIHADSMNRDTGHITSLTGKNKLEYSEDFDYIKGRGNFSWSYDVSKKPYSLNLKENASLAELPAYKHYKLLALYFEGDKLHSKIAYDMAKILGAPAYVESNWVNLYINGEYRGLYLLTPSITEATKYHQPNTEYIFEKETAKRCLDLNPGDYILTDNEMNFLITSPDEAADYAYAKSYLQRKEDAIYTNNYSDEIDIESFATQFLIDEISLNYDAFKTSSYYFKKTNSGKLYSGPAWDYDGSFGEYLHHGEKCVNYLGTTIGFSESQLKWWYKLAESETFKKAVAQKLKSKNKQLRKLYTRTVPKYAKLIEASVHTDDIIWPWDNTRAYKPGSYNEWDSNIRYLQYFMSSRLNALNLQYCGHSLYNDVSSNNIAINRSLSHTVTFVNEDGSIIHEAIATDGDRIEFASIPELSDYDETLWEFSYSGENYNSFLPILEDCTLVYGDTSEYNNNEQDNN